MRLGLQLVKDVGAESARLISGGQSDRHGPYVTAGDLVRRTGLKPQAVQSLVMAGAFDGIDAEPQRGAVGGRTIPQALAERPGRFACLHGGRRAPTGRTSRTVRRWWESTG